MFRGSTYIISEIRHNTVDLKILHAVGIREYDVRDLNLSKSVEAKHIKKVPMQIRITSSISYSYGKAHEKGAGTI